MATDPKPQPELITVRIVVTGRVQGVGYRAFVQDEAEELHIRGWVRNRKDGSVEALLHGTQSQIDDLLRACRKGPPASRVDNIDIFPAEFDGRGDFRIEGTL